MSTYLQYNNHMILHPTDPSKYFYGIVEDPPEPPGPTFDEVTIGSQTWMSKNLAIDDGQGGIYTQTVNYGQGDVTEYYYTWDAAVRVANSISGWHLTSNDEWTALANAVGGFEVAGTKLKSSTGWSSGNGTDDYGFTALPAGKWYPSTGFDYLGTRAYFWTADARSSTGAYMRYFDTGPYMKSDYYDETYAYSVRLIKDS